ncbi:hypothetical protein BC833DRAFT_568269, partial [Globomyces pollinis-pini]
MKESDAIESHRLDAFTQLFLSERQLILKIQPQSGFVTIQTPFEAPSEKKEPNCHDSTIKYIGNVTEFIQINRNMFSAVVLALVSSSIAAPAYGYDKAAPAYVTPTTTPCAETIAAIATPAYDQVAPIATAPYNTAAPIVATTPCETPNVYATAAPIATP